METLADVRAILGKNFHIVRAWDEGKASIQLLEKHPASGAPLRGLSSTVTLRVEDMDGPASVLLYAEACESLASAMRERGERALQKLYAAVAGV